MQEELPKLNVNLAEMPTLTCEKCESIFFKESVVFKKISKFTVGADKDQLYPIPLLRCENCGHTNTDLLPSILKDDKTITGKSDIILKGE